MTVRVSFTYRHIIGLSILPAMGYEIQLSATSHTVSDACHSYECMQRPDDEFQAQACKLASTSKLSPSILQISPLQNYTSCTLLKLLVIVSSQDPPHPTPHPSSLSPPKSATRSTTISATAPPQFACTSTKIPEATRPNQSCHMHPTPQYPPLSS